MRTNISDAKNERILVENFETWMNFFGRAYSIWTTNGWLNVDRDVLNYKSVATNFERMTNKRVNDANVTEN